MTVHGVRLHCRRDRALGDDARIKDEYRDEVGSGSKRRVGAPGDADPFIALGVPGAVVKDRPPILNVVVLSIADIQIHVDIGIDGFQREDYAGGTRGNLQPERFIPSEDRRAVNRSQAEGGGLSGRERAAADRRKRSIVAFHCHRERGHGDDARIKEGYRDEVGSGSKRRVGLGVMTISSLPVSPSEE